MADDPKSLAPAQPLCCSFCGHNQFEVRQLIAGGPDQATPSVFICNECVMMCVEILLESGYVRLQFEQTTPPPAEKPRRGRRRKIAG